MPTTSINELNQRLGIPGIAEVVAGDRGLPKVHISLPAATGDIYLHGAHVTSWRPHGADDALFLSSASKWEEGKAIRGGVPISFPWFADKANDSKAPAHGFVRTNSCSLDSIARDEDTITVTMSIASNESTKRWWPSDFRAVYRASFGEELRLELEVHNTGSTMMRFEEAFHAYFKVSDMRSALVAGLEALHYLDNTDHCREKTQTGDLAITSETDRVYLDTQSPVELLDAALQRRIEVTTQNSRTIVIWNPWAEKAKAMSDLGDGQWTQFVCIEASNVLAFAVEVAPGEAHALRAVISARSNGDPSVGPTSL